MAECLSLLSHLEIPMTNSCSSIHESFDVSKSSITFSIASSMFISVSSNWIPTTRALNSFADRHPSAFSSIVLNNLSIKWWKVQYESARPLFCKMMHSYKLLKLSMANFCMTSISGSPSSVKSLPNACTLTCFNIPDINCFCFAYSILLFWIHGWNICSNIQR